MSTATKSDLKAQFENQYARTEPSIDDFTEDAAKSWESCLWDSC